MRRTVLLAFMIGLVLVAEVHGAIVISAHGVPTPGLSGFTTYTVTATSDGAEIQTFDFSTPPGETINPNTSRGFFGAMNHVNPAGQPTVFQDNNAFIGVIGADVLQDSQFLFTTSAGLLYDSDRSRESATSLQATFSTPEPLGLSVPFAQLVIPNDGSVIQYRGMIGTADGSEFDINMSFLPDLPDPSPVILDAIVFATHGEMVEHTFLQPDEDPPVGLTWDNFMFDGPGAAQSPSFDPLAPLFTWDTTGSAPGEYIATVEFTSSGGVPVTAMLTVFLAVPEPACGVLCGVALVGVVGFSRCRRSCRRL